MSDGMRELQIREVWPTAHPLDPNTGVRLDAEPDPVTNDRFRAQLQGKQAQHIAK